MTNHQRFTDFTEHLCSDAHPSVFLRQVLSTGGIEEYPFCLLTKLVQTPQSPIHHPEGNAWEHTCLVVDQAARLRGQSKEPDAFMWAALLHDIGKPSTTRTRHGRITSYDHDKAGLALSTQFLSALTQDALWIRRVANLVRYHMHLLFVLKDMPFGDVASMKRDTDLREVALLAYCDRMGRTNAKEKTELFQAQRFLEKCGHSGPLLLPEYTSAAP